MQSPPLNPVPGAELLTVMVSELGFTDPTSGTFAIAALLVTEDPALAFPGWLQLTQAGLRSARQTGLPYARPGFLLAFVAHRGSLRGPTRARGRR